jgi:hypothetical protein
MAWELLAVVAGFILLSEALQRLLAKALGEGAVPKGRLAERLIVRGFAVITFPLVVLICLAAAIWLLPYLLLSKPYRLHLREARRARRTEREAWAAHDPFSRQLASLDVLDFLRLPFEPIFAFLDWLEKHPRRWGLPHVRPLKSPASRSSPEIVRPAQGDATPRP